MNWPERGSAPELTSSTEHAKCAAPLFAGDCGELPLETRRALVQLIAGPSLDGRRHPKLWPVLLRDEQVIRKRLSEFFLDLVIDNDLQVAFTRQTDTGDLEVPRLLRRLQLTFVDSVLLLYLRQRLTQSNAEGNRAVVATDEINEHLLLYERSSNTDRAGFMKRVRASVEKLKAHSILQNIRSSQDRFEVSPALKLLFSAGEIQALNEEYRRIAAVGIGSSTVEDEHR